MRSIEQLAHEAYEVYCAITGTPNRRWDRLHDFERQAWISIVQTIRAGIEAVH